MLDSSPREDSSVISRHKINVFGPEDAFDSRVFRTESNHLALCGPHGGVRCDSLDRRGKGARGDNRPCRVHFFVLQNQPTAADAFAPECLGPIAGKNLDAAALRCSEDCIRQQAVVHRAFIRPEHCSSDVFAQGRFEFARILSAPPAGAIGTRVDSWTSRSNSSGLIRLSSAA
jgi:hypothetical protein